MGDAQVVGFELDSLDLSPAVAGGQMVEVAGVEPASLVLS